jgi:hypothetical protein
MYAAQAVLSELLGPDWVYLGKWGESQGGQGYRFRSKGREIIIVWARRRTPVRVPEGFVAWDLMGNPISEPQLEATEEPVYFVGRFPQE